MSDKKKVRVTRRRRGESSGERAEAPRRQRPSGSAPSSQPTSGGSGARPPSYGPRPSGGGLPIGNMNPLLLIGIIVVLCICVVPAIFLLGGGDSGDLLPSEQPAAFEPPTNNEPVVQPETNIDPAENLSQFSEEPFVPPANASTEGQTWLVMLYQDADDRVLEEDIYLDLNEAEQIGSSDRVHIVSQMDRFNAGYRGDGDWSSTKRFYLTYDDDLQRIRSQQVADLGEVNMSAGETLVDFATWAIDTFPADKHVLILSDHGMGWPGGWSDPEPKGRVDSSIPLTNALGDQLYLMELDEALAEIRAQTGLEQFEMIGMDACLMGHLEVFSALAPHARYAVASQEVEPALGWAYAGFLDDLNQNPDMDGAALSRLIVDSYIDKDQRIVDDRLRAAMLQRGSSLGGLFNSMNSISAQQLASQMGQTITLTAVDLAAMPNLVESVNDLTLVMQSASQRDVAKARQYAQSFTSIFGKEVPPSYIDLGNFVQLLQRESSDANVDRAVDGVMDALDTAVIAERHGPKKPGASGVSIYFPNSQLYRNPVTGPESYTAVARRFADASLWDDFLAFHYTGRTFDSTNNTLAVPDRAAQITAPGAGVISVSPVTLSGDVAAPGSPILLSTDISGENIGYVKLFVGYYDDVGNSINVADMDYLESADTREIDGIYYPDWGTDADFTMEFEWEPIVFAISDGVNLVPALFTPEEYGASFEEAIYSVDGIYTYANGGETRNATLYFQNGLLRQVIGFTQEDSAGAPREVVPEPGDTFTVLEQWMDLDNNGRVANTAVEEGGVLTFGDEMFTWEVLDAAPGKYVVGFVVEDLDGSPNQVFETVTVE